jgi:hypothetical protein
MRDRREVDVLERGADRREAFARNDIAVDPNGSSSTAIALFSMSRSSPCAAR